MAKWYFTCGQIHRHKIESKVWDKDSVIVVEAETEQIAVDFVFSLFGTAWGGVYGDFENISRYYKNGIAETFIVEKIGYETSPN